MTGDTAHNPSADRWASFRGLPKKLTVLLEKESDRGAILILGAYLDEILGMIIRSATVSEDQGDALLEHRQPAGDFSGRISLCQAFGLIDVTEAQALNLIRKIRNKAAHFEGKGRGFDVLFDSPGTVDQVHALTNCLFPGHTANGKDSPRERFVLATRMLAIRLYMRGLGAMPAQVPLSSKEHANAIREAVKGTADEARYAEIDKAVARGDLDALKAMLKQQQDALERMLPPPRPGQGGSA